jgi:hypothetical protein
MSRKNAHHLGHAYDRRFGTCRDSGVIQSLVLMGSRTIPFTRPIRSHRAGAEAMDDKQLAKLVKKTVAKASKPKSPQRKTYDKTLDVTRRPQTDEDLERNDFFEIMKKREF